jgi:DNA polymerase-1
MQKEIDTFEQKIYDRGWEIQPSTLNNWEIFFDKLKIGGAKQKKTKTGQYATSRKVELPCQW